MGFKKAISGLFDDDKNKSNQEKCKGQHDIHHAQNPLYGNIGQNENMIRPSLNYRDQQVNNVDYMYSLDRQKYVNAMGGYNQSSKPKNTYYNHDFNTIETPKGERPEYHDPQQAFNLHDNIIRPSKRLRNNSNIDNVNRQYQVSASSSYRNFDYSPTIEQTLEHENIYTRDDGLSKPKKTMKQKRNSNKEFLQKKKFINQLSEEELNNLNATIRYDQSYQKPFDLKGLNTVSIPGTNGYGFQENITDKEVQKKHRKEIFEHSVPKFIIKEILLEKWKSFIFSFLTGIGLIISLSLISFFYYGKNHDLSTVFGIEWSMLPKPFWTISLSIVFLVFFIMSMLNFKRAIVESEKVGISYSRNEPMMPTFITDNYRKSIVSKIVVTWLASVFYGIGLIVLGFLSLFQAHKGQDFSLFFWHSEAIPDLSLDITINIILLVLMLAYHITTIILAKKKEMNIKTHFGYDLIDFETKTKIKKATNKKCLISFLIFITVLFVVVIIPYLIFKKRKSGQWTWPWQTQSVINR